MDKNFQLLSEYKIFKDNDSVFKKISDIFQRLENNDIDVIGNSLRKVLEEILSNINEIDSSLSLNEKINELKSMKRYIPSNVLSGIYSLIKCGDNESHARVRNAYDLNLTSNEVIVLLRNLWLLIKWMACELRGIESLRDIKHEDLKERVGDIIKVDDSLSNSDANMQAEKLTIGQLLFLKDYKFNIPTYQRDYNWSNDNVIKILEDLKERKRDFKTHYMGSLAIAIDSESKILRVIDGQQRITTSLLFFKAFYEVMKERKIIIPNDLTGFIDQKITTIYQNQDILSSQKEVSLILKGGKINNYSKTSPYSKFKELKGFLEKQNNDDILEYFNIYSTKFEIALLVFKTTIDNEMDIFENLNTGGSKLKSCELIRSYLFSTIEPKVFLDNEKEIDEFYISSIIIPINHASKSESTTDIDKFYMAYNRYNFIVNRNGIASSDLYGDFKKTWRDNELPKIKSLKGFQEEMSDLVKMLNIYKELVFDYESNESKLHGYSHIIKFINREDVMPILMYSIKQYCEINDIGKIKKVGKNFVKVIRIIESYFIRSEVYGNNFKRVFDTFLLNNQSKVAEEIYGFLKKDMVIPFGSLSEFQNKLSSANLRKSVITSIVHHLELRLRGIELGKSGYIEFELTHEHILAKKLKYENYDNNSITKDEFQETLKDLSDNIGNALLLPRSDNSKVGNKKFSDKIAVYQKGSYLSKGTTNNEIMDITQKETFTFDDVKKRSKQIAKYIVENDIYYNE